MLGQQSPRQFPNLDKDQFDALKQQFDDAARHALPGDVEVADDRLLELTKRGVRPWS